jgi:prophage DNA circulation protein
MAVYDDEECIAINHCDDVLTAAVRDARAVAAQTILSQNIRLPGVSQSAVDGLWPSLVVAHKLYFDGARYAEVENYNPTMSPYFMGRAVVAPSA